jgi:hypothetical protein
VVKFASENSTRPIDEYEGLAFTVPNFNSATPAEFIENIRSHLTKILMLRDYSEQIVDTVDVSSWLGYTAEIEAYKPALIDAVQSDQILTGQVDPEVIL